MEIIIESFWFNSVYNFIKKEAMMPEFTCPVCGNPIVFEDDLCNSCGDLWNEYWDWCDAFNQNPTREGFVEFGGNPEIWDHII